MSTSGGVSVELIGVAMELAAKKRSDAVPMRELRRYMMAIGVGDLSNGSTARLWKVDQITQVTLYRPFASLHSFSFRSYELDML